MASLMNDSDDRTLFSRSLLSRRHRPSQFPTRPGVCLLESFAVPPRDGGTVCRGPLLHRACPRASTRNSQRYRLWTKRRWCGPGYGFRARRIRRRRRSAHRPPVPGRRTRKFEKLRARCCERSPSTIATRSAASSSTTPRSKPSESLGLVRVSTAFVEVVRVSAIDTCLTTNATVSKTPHRRITSAHYFTGRSADRHFTGLSKARNRSPSREKHSRRSLADLVPNRRLSHADLTKCRALPRNFVEMEARVGCKTGSSFSTGDQTKACSTVSKKLHDPHTGNTRGDGTVFAFPFPTKSRDGNHRRTGRTGVSRQAEERMMATLMHKILPTRRGR